MPSRRLRDRALRRKAAVALSANKQSESRYVRQLRGIMAAVHKATLNQIGDTAPTPYELALITAKIQAALPTAVNAAFTKMSHDVVLHNAKALQTMGVPVGPQVRQQRLVRAGRGDAIGKTLAKQLGDPGLATAIDAARQANIALITNAARDYAADVQKVFNDPKNIGLHVKDLTDKLVERGNVSQSRAELIARDQTLKLNGNITQIRQQAAGITSYTWSTSNDERVRDEHRALEGQVFTWGNPPSVGAPGEDFQCRCIAVPIIEGLEEIFGDPVAPVEEAPVEEPTIDLPEEEDIVIEPPPPKPQEPIVVVLPPKPEKKVKEIKPPKPEKPVVVIPPPPPKPEEPVVIELEEPKYKEPTPWGPAEPAKPTAVAAEINKDLLAPASRPVVEGDQIKTVYNESGVPDKELHDLMQVIQPDAGHEAFLREHPLASIAIKDHLENNSHGLAYYWHNRLDLADSVNFKPSELVPGGSFLVNAGAKTVEEYKQQVFVHEFGHYIHLGGTGADRLGQNPLPHTRTPLQNEIDDVVKTAFKDNGTKTSKWAISRYAQQDHLEYFAESYTAYRYYPDTLLSYDPVGHAMVEKVLKLRGIR